MIKALFQAMAAGVVWAAAFIAAGFLAHVVATLVLFGWSLL